MSDAAQCAATETVLVAIPGTELRRQVTAFLAAQGYACIATATLDDALRIAGNLDGDPELMIADVRLPEAPRKAMAIARRRMRAVFLCSEPEFIAREAVADPAVTFLETPFAWRELDRVLSGYKVIANAA